MHIYIKSVDAVAAAEAQKRFDNLIKPKDALGKLENMVKTYAAVRGVAKPEKLECLQKGILLFASPENIEETGKLMEREKELNINVILAQTPAEAMEEGAILAEEFISKGQYKLICIDVLDKNNLSFQGAAGAMLQAAAMGTGILHNGTTTEKILKFASKQVKEVGNYVVGTGDILAFSVEKAWVRAKMNFSIFDAALKCYKEMETFAEAGVNLPL